MSFRNGDKARSGRLRKQRDAKRLKVRELRASLAAPAAAPEAGSVSEDGVLAKTARTIGSTLGTIASATHLVGHEAEQ